MSISGSATASNVSGGTAGEGFLTESYCPGSVVPPCSGGSGTQDVILRITPSSPGTVSQTDTFSGVSGLSLDKDIGAIGNNGSATITSVEDLFSVPPYLHLCPRLSLAPCCCWEADWPDSRFSLNGNNGVWLLSGPTRLKLTHGLKGNCSCNLQQKRYDGLSRLLEGLDKLSSRPVPNQTFSGFHRGELQTVAPSPEASCRLFRPK